MREAHDTIFRTDDPLSPAARSVVERTPEGVRRWTIGQRSAAQELDRRPTGPPVYWEGGRSHPLRVRPPRTDQTSSSVVAMTEREYDHPYLLTAEHLGTTDRPREGSERANDRFHRPHSSVNGLEHFPCG